MIPPVVTLRTWVKSPCHNRGYTRFGEGSAACGPCPKLTGQITTNPFARSRPVQTKPYGRVRVATITARGRILVLIRPVWSGIEKRRSQAERNAEYGINGKNVRM